LDRVVEDARSLGAGVGEGSLVNVLGRLEFKLVSVKERE